MVVPRGHLRIFCRAAVNLLRGWSRFFREFGWKMAEPEGELQVQQQCKDQERHCKDCLNYPCRIR